MHLIMVVVTDIFGGFTINEYDPIDWGSIEDKKHFRDLTTKIGTVIMGRKTFESIGKPLKDRLNIVLTNKNFKNDKNILFLKGNPQEIISSLEKKNIKSAAVIGGKKVFEEFFPYIDKIFITIEPIILENSQKLSFKRENFKLITTNVLNERGTIVLEYEKLP
ncbi:dihydrofolate reductase [Thermosipho melanesiensis]|uniref:dihydrofolate reductase n=2 Tax=Thermosipho melanesiensis TaxID=46541 RepID=A6LKQ9_THEM4|nr:dihydrofolate reductase [Thermosipho melanesiensis]ABR30510.1 dihydrofolate reductase region [Thermosipho melanesiensis BI429]APT73661.1 dihydrofolate reductase [Thermosipho melanesiensis]OOC35602.1 dihydrofolate reductase [Thermosipho melanesiensis]OOC39276.1 dihydrofolate reductase [Thermosipho melanesiensis]OOC39362.1 dihydrofolate reductase [Thermosipho melanesiensis]